MFLKVVKQLAPINLPHHYHQQELTYHTCQFHPLHFIVPTTSTTNYQMSYFSKTIKDWNNLPHTYIECDSLQVFTTYLRCIMTTNYLTELLFSDCKLCS